MGTVSNIFRDPGSLFSTENLIRGALAYGTGGASEVVRGGARQLSKASKGTGLEGITQPLEDITSLGSSAKRRDGERSAAEENFMKDVLKGAPKLPGKPIEANSAAARALRARGRTGRRGTILTSPLGLQGEPLLRRKTLLGQ